MVIFNGGGSCFSAAFRPDPAGLGRQTAQGPTRWRLSRMRAVAVTAGGRFDRPRQHRHGEPRHDGLGQLHCWQHQPAAARSGHRGREPARLRRHRCGRTCQPGELNRAGFHPVRTLTCNQQATYAGQDAVGPCDQQLVLPGRQLLIGDRPAGASRSRRTQAKGPPVSWRAFRVANWPGAEARRVTCASLRRA